MKVILNTTRRPLKVHLGRDKVLHLGPGKEGRISTHDADRPSVLRLIEEGSIRVVGDGATAGSAEAGGPLHEDTHGFHPKTAKKRGDR